MFTILHILPTLVLALLSENVPETPLPGHPVANANSTSPAKFVRNCAGGDSCCLLITYWWWLEQDNPPRTSRARGDPLVQSIHPDIRYQRENICREQYGGEKEWGQIGHFSCRDTLPGIPGLDHHLDTLHRTEALPYDTLPISNGLGIHDRTVYLPAEQSKYRYNYCFRCPPLFEIVELAAEFPLYGGHTDTISLPDGSRWPTQRPRKSIVCRPKSTEEERREAIQVSGLAHLPSRTRDCVDGAEPSGSSTGQSLVIELSATTSSPNNEWAYVIGLSGSITEKGKTMTREERAPDFGTTWTKSLPANTVRQVTRIFRGCIEFDRLPGYRGSTLGAINLRLTRVDTASEERQ